MGVISWIILGLIAGYLAKWIMPGRDPGGFVLTILIGVAGGLIGGFVATGLGWGSMDGIGLYSILLAVAGALVLLIGFRLLRPQPKS